MYSRGNCANRIYTPETNPPPSVPSTNALEVDPPSAPAPSKPPVNPMYDSLHTNLPIDVMQFRDFPFPPDSPVFPTHRQVLDYIQSFAEHYNLLPLVRFNTTVVCAEPIGKTWQITSTEWKQGMPNTKTEEYDAVVVASGHYIVPYIPDIPGLAQNKDKRRIMHSSEYRHADTFANKSIVVIGNGSSATDIVREASATAARVYHCVRRDTAFSLALHENMPPHTSRVAPIARIDENVITCQDGQRLEDVDTIVFATGYLYSFPFLPFEKDELIKDGQKVLNLIHRIFYKRNPTLAFVGLPIRIVPFPLFQAQSILIARYWAGRVPLPPFLSGEDNENNSREDMIMTTDSQIEYMNGLNAWSEGWQSQDKTGWISSDPLTGRVTPEWKERREQSLALRTKFLGY